MIRGTATAQGAAAIATRQSRGEEAGRASTMPMPPGWYWLALVAIVALSAFLNCFRLARQGYGNLYYAAAVKSMLLSWHNFFYVSFDPAGFVSVDKPPLGLWLQAGSARLFGFHGVSLLLPQAVAGVLSVAVLCHLVAHSFGPTAGLLAAAALAVTPIDVATARSNTMDGLLVLVLLLAAWATIRAAEQGQLWRLLLGSALVGVGFNVKMLEAFLVAPALTLLYLLVSPRRWRTRVVHLALAGLVLVTVSLAWVVAVDLTPAANRPYVESSTNNTELDVVIGRNGAGRVMTGATAASDRELGKRGPFRLLDQPLASQTSWLLPWALFGGVAICLGGAPRRRMAAFAGIVLWGSWFLSQAAFYSAATHVHRYYLVTLAPAIAALAGAGVPALWALFRRPGWRGWLLPAALLATAAEQVRILSAYPVWRDRLAPPVVAAVITATGLLLAPRLLRRRGRQGRSVWNQGLVALGAAALLIGPGVWSAFPVWTPQRDTAAPYAGPGGQSMPDAAAVDPALIALLTAHQGRARFLVATETTEPAAPLILATGKPVLAFGGFSGTDPILPPRGLPDLVAAGEVRFFLLPPQPEALTSSSPGVRWVAQTCAAVDSTFWRSPGRGRATPAATRGHHRSTLAAQYLYDCGEVGRGRPMGPR